MLLYIDPPYNTGKKDFIYNDKYVDTDDSFRHSKWTSFMYYRLSLAKKLLNKKGIIFISIDDNEIAQLKLLCDGIFGEGNFISILSIENNPKGRKNSDFISVCNDYCLIYAKDKGKSYFTENIPKQANDLTIDDNGVYVHNSGKRVLVGENRFNPVVKDFQSAKHYSVYYNKAKNKIKIEKEKNINEINKALLKEGYKRYYSFFKNNFVLNTYTETKIIELFRDGSLEFKNSSIYEKNFSTKIRLKSLVINKKYGAIINNKESEYQIDVKTTSAGTELKDMFSTDQIPFNNPKNIGLIKILITLLEDKSITILDFFAGSGTTGHAILKLNKEDGGNRKFILCNNNENKIAEEVCYSRIGKAIKGYKNKKGEKVGGLGGNLKYYKTDFVDSEHINKISDDSKIKLTYQAGEIIALREDTLDEIEKNEWWQIFTDGEKQTAIYFKEDKSKLKKLIEKLSKNKKSVLYIFSWGKNEYKNEFSGYENIRIEDIPEPILEVYKELNKL
jgi:adenine-specific DNA-methyltransferase